MKFVIQRVLEASVKVNDQIVGAINQGILVLLGFTQSDKYEDLDFAANKLLSLRLWEDNKGVKWKEGVKSKNYELLIVSQFTLYSILKGNKPDFHNAMDPNSANKMYDTFISIIKKKYNPDKISTGIFGAMMQVSLVNDGPITINWEYPETKEIISYKESINKKMIIDEEINKNTFDNNLLDKGIASNNKLFKINDQILEEEKSKEVDKI